MKLTLIVSLLGVALSLSSANAHWPQFRGPNSSGLAEKEKPPIEFNAGTNLLWKVEVPPGLSSPCVWGDRIFLTAFEHGKLFALGFDRRDGKEVWRQEAPPGKIPDVHPTSSPAVATPVTDGNRVYVFFSSFGLVAYDFKGKEQWRKALPVNFVMNGSGTSPAIASDTIVLNCDQDEGESFVLAVDAKTGTTRWKTPRENAAGSFTTPIVWKRGRQQDVIVAGSLRVAGYDMRDGKERWTANVMTSVAVTPTPVIGDGQLYVMSRGVPPNAMGAFASFVEKNDKNSDGKIGPGEAPGFDGGAFRGIDRDKDGFITDKDWTGMTNLFGRGDSGLFALRAPDTGDTTSTHVAWKATKGISGYSSPLFYDGRVYVVQDGGRVSCWNAKTGKSLYEQERLGAEGEYYASPIAANGHIYLASTRGMVTVAQAGDSMNVKAKNNLGESIMATPAIADDKFYVRSEKHLWVFGKR